MRAKITKRRSSYEVTITKDGKRIRRSFKKRSQADDWSTKVQLKILASPDVELTEFRAKWMHNAQMRDAYIVTKENHWDNAKDGDKSSALGLQACEYFGSDFLSELTKADIDGYTSYLKNELGNSDATINRKLSALSMILKEAVDYGWIESYPKITRKKSEPARLSFFNDTERKQIRTQLAMSSANYAYLFTFLCDTGLRITEALSLAWTDIKLVDDVMCVHVREGKKDESLPRFVPLTKDAHAVITYVRQSFCRSIQSGPFTNLSYSQCRRVWEQMRKTLGREEKDFVWHTCRHTFCSRLVQQGVDLAQVAQLAGHKNIATTMRYVHLDTKSSLTAIDKLNG